MLRAFAGAIAGYIFLAIFVTVAFALLWLSLGKEFAFRPGTLEVTVAWSLLSLLVSLVAAVLGGWMAVHVGRSPKAAYFLAGLVLVFGILSALGQILRPGLDSEGQAAVLEKVAAGELGNVAVSQHARQPPWLAIALPLLGTLGVLTGGAMRQRDGL